MDPIWLQLRSFPAAHGYSRDALINFVRAAHWRRADTISKLQLSLRKRAAGVFRKWRSLSKQLGCSPKAALLNLIACAEEADLFVYSILLRYEQVISKSTLGDVVQKVIDTLPRSDPELSFVNSLILNERHPPLSSLNRLLEPRQLFDSRFWTALGDGVVSVNSLEKAFGTALTGSLKNEGDICVSAMVEYTRSQKWPAFISPLLLETLPPSIRRAALREPRLLASDLRLALEEDPFFHPDAPAVQARKTVLKDALNDIKRSSYLATTVTQLVRDQKLFQSVLKEVRATLKSRLWWLESRGTISLIRELRQLPDCPEALALLLLSVPSSQRCKLLLAANDQVGRDAFSYFDPEFFIGITKDAPRKTALSLLRFVDKPTQRQTVLQQCVSRAPYSRSVSRNHLIEWLDRAKTTDITKAMRCNESLILAILKSPRCDTKVLTAIEDSFMSLSAAAIFKLLKPVRRKQYLKIDLDRANKMIRTMAKHLCEKEVVCKWLNSTTLSSFAKWFPSFAPLALRNYCPPRAFQTVCDTPNVWKQGEEVAEQMMQLKEKNSFRWQGYLRRLSPQSRPLPTAMKRYIESHPEMLKEAFELAPVVFWHSVRSRYPLKTLLKVAFRYRKLAADLEKRVSRAKLRSTIPWITATWSNNPTLAVAYEVAASFSLPDANYLISLAKDLRPPFDDENRGKAFDNHYRTYELPKKSGGKRTITVPSPPLKRLQRRLLNHGFDEVPLHDAAMGFRKVGFPPLTDPGL